MVGIVEGSIAQTEVVFTTEMVAAFGDLTGDTSPVHFDPVHAKALGFHRPIVHGFLVSAAYSMLLGSRLPGPNSVIQKVSIDMVAPVYTGDKVSFTVAVTRFSEAVGAVVLALSATNQNDVQVSRGSAVCILRRSE